MRLSEKITSITTIISNTLYECIQSILRKQVVILHIDQVKLSDVPELIDKIVISDFPYRFDFNIDAIEGLANPRTGKEAGGLVTYGSLTILPEVYISMPEATVDLIAEGLCYGIPNQHITTTTNTSACAVSTNIFDFKIDTVGVLAPDPDAE